MKTFTRSPNEFRELDELPAAEMTPDEFARHTVVVPVKQAANPSSRIRLEVSPGSETRLDDFRSEVERVISRGASAPQERANMVNRAITECLSIDLRDQIWASRLPGGKSLVLVKADVLLRVAEREVVEFVHQAEVDAAVLQGRHVAPDVLAYYQSKPRQNAKAGAAAW